MRRLRCSFEEAERIRSGGSGVTEPSSGDGVEPRADPGGQPQWNRVRMEFQLDLALDVERERLLLYRVVLVLELLAGALLVRQALLWYFVR